MLRKMLLLSEKREMVSYVCSPVQLRDFLSLWERIANKQSRSILKDLRGFSEKSA